MTLILNVLHKDMTILAADKKGVADWPSVFGFTSRGKAICDDLEKVKLNSSGSLAIATSGYSEHNSYISDVEGSETFAEGMSIIRNHISNFLQVDDLDSLIKSASPFENECIATFYDNDTETFFTNEFGFNEFSNRTRLHRAGDEVKLFCAGSGRSNVDVASVRSEVQRIAETEDSSHLQHALIAWMRETFRKVSLRNEGCGAEAVFAVATRSNRKFHFV